MDSRVIVVEPDTSAEFSSINAAIRAAADGDTVMLKAGTYEEKVILDRAVNLVVDPDAEPGDTVITSGVICTIPQQQQLQQQQQQQQSPNATVISSVGRPDTGASGTGSSIMLNNNNNNNNGSMGGPSGTLVGGSISNIVIHRLLDIRAGSGVLVQNCEIVGNGGDGVRICTGANPTIRSCKIHSCDGFNTGAGVYFQEGSNGTVEGCDISGARTEGVHVKGASNAVITGNTIHDNPIGVYFRKGGRGHVDKNTITACSSFGIYVQSGSDPLVVANTVEGCGIHAILISNAGCGNFKDNAVSAEGSVRVYMGCSPTLGTNHFSGKVETEAPAPGAVVAAA